jgi:diguanylate cyclase (GGDEF)-like protein
MDHRHDIGLRAILPGAGILVLGAAATLIASTGPPLVPLLALGLAGAASSALSGRRREDPGFRLAPAFFLAGLVCLPPGAALLVGAVAVTIAPRGLAGSSRTTIAPALAVVATVLAAALVPRPEPMTSWLACAYLGALHLLLHGVAWLTGGLERARRPGPQEHRAFLDAVSRELVDVPVAWLLALLASTPGVPVPALPLAAALVVLAGSSVARVERADDRIRAVNDSLAERVTELATLHAVGREIVSSLDLRRVISIIDRECRKILLVDEFAITLTDPDTGELRATYRRRRGQAPVEAEQTVVREGLDSRVARERRGIRVDDLAARFAPRSSLFEDATGSAMAVPLLVENRVVGVLSVRSDLAGAFDDHRLAFLTTIAQQAAVAIENARHYRMATRDSLTGLFLRDYFFRRVDEEFQRARRYRTPFALLMVDLDGFKRVNDEHGHPAGDRYLRAIGRTIRGHLRVADHACRYGGDEFCILLPETDRAGAATIAERLRQSIARVDLGLEDTAPLTATASVGLAAFPEDGADDVALLLRRADEALYRAKRAGRDRVTAWRTAPAPDPSSATGTGGDR